MGVFAELPLLLRYIFGDRFDMKVSISDLQSELPQVLTYQGNRRTFSGRSLYVINSSNLSH